MIDKVIGGPKTSKSSRETWHSDEFAIYFHYGGGFENIDGVKNYTGGSFVGRYGFDPDKFGYFDIEEEVKKLGNCARHVYMNWKKTHKEHDLKKLYWKAVKSTYVEKFKSAIQEMKVESRAAYEDFIGRDTKKFCKAFISTSACSDMITSNIAESFNASTVEARGKHIIHMFEEIRCTLMTQQVSRLHKISKVHGRICPNIMEKIEKLKFDSREYTAHPALGGKFEVHFEDDKFVVNLGDRTCTCRVWDLTGIPCVHGLACIRFKNEDATTFVDVYYIVSRYLEGYKVGLEPIRGQRMWPEVEETIVKPPVIRRMPGRPKKKRRRAPEEKDPKCPKKKELECR
ncbi:uncharacterized protein LOC121792753 isoform X2 [Salvia splendens]|uniref:uncharacterized protein LOC121792753 isoform X2 n=1 Tax=Salvia splendens TaxID=180675 RepID=UPI001C27B618|nr:uncharacterized protein LOC121792753 isoform X2 [Salvia splendens]